LRDTNPLADQPSVRICRFALLELGDMLAYGEESVAALVDSSCRQRLAEGLSLLDACLAAAGGLDGTDTPSSETVQRRYATTPISINLAFAEYSANLRQLHGAFGPPPAQ
jgi:hypothetical protein